MDSKNARPADIITDLKLIKRSKNNIQCPMVENCSHIATFLAPKYFKIKHESFWVVLMLTRFLTLLP